MELEQLLAVVGGSLGGLQVLPWATDHPDRMRTAVVVAAAPHLSSQGVAFDVIGRNAIRHDPRFADGQYYDDETPESGLAIARMLAHITCLSDESMRTKFAPARLMPERSAPTSRASSPSDPISHIRATDSSNVSMQTATSRGRRRWTSSTWEERTTSCASHSRPRPAAGSF
ncbi:MAG: hypothetical protein CL933_00495 [Deltaproteobacteria bacterium]|nr:hypothetical protein [Deltaproteobacteria bacterium]